eukprot:5782785-Lingulodinium_polyedra.AAC.1
MSTSRISAALRPSRWVARGPSLTLARPSWTGAPSAQSPRQKESYRRLRRGVDAKLPEVMIALQIDS